MKYSKNTPSFSLSRLSPWLPLSRASWRLLPLLPSILLGLQANAVSDRDLLMQAERPSVGQTLGLMQTGWRPDPLVNATHLPKIPNKGVAELQNDFPTWYGELLRGAPRMIACFEKAFPGATWAFIGRDTAPLADFFETFYLSLGQTDRVARIPMSSGTLDSLQPGAALSLLAKNGLDTTRLTTRKHPYIFVDAVSKKGGTQGRFLLNTILKDYPQNHASLLQMVNFIGLRVSTTDLPSLDACNAYQILHSKEYRNLAEYSYFDPRLVLTYHDQRQGHSYLGINEAGYTHWVGAWHGPFGGVHSVAPGEWSDPEIGIPSSIAERKYVLDYQAHLILAAQAPFMLQAVQKAAQGFGYHFPIGRPMYFAFPTGHLKEVLKHTHTLKGISEALSQFYQYNLGRATFGVISKSLIEAVNHASESTQSSANLAEEAMSYLDILNLFPKENRDEFIRETTSTFFALDPKIESINRVMAFLQNNSELKRFFAAEALNYFNLKPTEEAVRDYQAFNRPTERFYGQDDYTVAEASFKKNHLKKTWSLKALFSKKGKK